MCSQYALMWQKCNFKLITHRLKITQVFFSGWMAELLYLHALLPFSSYKN